MSAVNNRTVMLTIEMPSITSVLLARSHLLKTLQRQKQHYIAFDMKVA